jgi:hypothetical protein
MIRTIAVLSFILSAATAFCQGNESNNSIKLFLATDSASTSGIDLPPKLQDRLLNKVTQLINKTGVAEVGYSNFWVQSKLDIIDNSLYQVGMTSLYQAECELFLTISRKQYGRSGGAVYKSFSKRYKGSARDKEGAIANAISNISSADIDVVEFFQQSKASIYQFFNTHCNEVIREAEQALELNDYGRSIALYFSIPSSAPCFSTAYKASKKVYLSFRNDECKRRLLQLRSLIAIIQEKNALSLEVYIGVMKIIWELDPTSDDCYNEALMEVKKIENKFDAEQKREWESAQKREANKAKTDEELAKAIGKISVTYRP